MVEPFPCDQRRQIRLHLFSFCVASSGLALPPVGRFGNGGRLTAPGPTGRGRTEPDPEGSNEQQIVHFRPIW
jgi:hypothetical protein